MNRNKPKKSYQVIIVGGGPVGLFLGCCLHHLDISFAILEKREERISHSRSLGIHPVSLELFETLGFADVFLDTGITIKRGLAFSDTGKIGSVSFASCPEPFNFILSLPQYKTEEILEHHLFKLEPNALVRGAKVTNITERTDHVTVEYVHSAQKNTLQTEFLVGCDGKESIVRKQAGIPFEGFSYPDTYIMGDFTDNTNFGSDAAVFLSKDGLIESFPLSGSRRRWVIKTTSYFESVTRHDIEGLVAKRISHDLSEEKNYMLSSFGVQKLVATPMAGGRIALAGDAAHIVSPIGGQGMNLGWLDAWDLSKVLEACLKKQDSNHNTELKKYAERRNKIAGNAIKRAELNMKLGRETSLPHFRNALVWLMLMPPLNKLMARLFTMRNLDSRLL